MSNLYSMHYSNTENKLFRMRVTQIEKYQTYDFKRAAHIIANLVVDGMTDSSADGSVKYYADKIVNAMYDTDIDEVTIKINIDKKLERVDIVVKYEDENGEDQRSILYIKNIERS